VRKFRFNPHPHTAGDFCRRGLRGEIVGFNPRPHTAGDESANAGRRRRVGFNPRPHTAGDLFGRPCRCVGAVSIHARTRRATSVNSSFLLRTSFQSTPAHGGRRGQILLWPAAACFNPRPHTAGDTTKDWTRCYTRLFQSTPAHGGRHAYGHTPPKMPGVSIHARTRRATRVNTLDNLFCFVSIHARTRRATFESKDEFIVWYVSIHARTRRATTAKKTLQPNTVVSIHARTRRATTGRQDNASFTAVSIHARTRRATPRWIQTSHT